MGIEHRHDSGLWFYTEYALVAETFANPDLITTRRHRDAVQSYLDDSSIPPWVLERLAESFPDNADQVMSSVLRRRAFSWAVDGESLLRQRKPDFYDRQPVSPGVAPAPAIALEHYASQT